MWLVVGALAMLASETVRTHAFSALTWACVMLADNAHDVAVTTAVLAVLCGAAAFIDARVVVSMFMDGKAAAARTDATNTAPADSNAPNAAPDVTSPPVYGTRDARMIAQSAPRRAVRGGNWVASWLLCCSLVSLVGHARSADSVLDHKVVLVIALGSMAYLTAVFGASLVLTQVNALSASVARQKKARRDGDDNDDVAVSSFRGRCAACFPSSCLRTIAIQLVLVLCAVLAAACLIVACTLGTDDLATFAAEAARAVPLFRRLATACTATTTVGGSSDHEWTAGAAFPWFLAAALGVVALYRHRGCSAQRSVSSVEPRSAAQVRLMRDARDRMRAATYPRPYPNGWYKVCNSDDLAPGNVRYVEAVGQHLCVFRGEEDGKVGVLDAFCPHLGANLAVGGTVRGNNLVCPFHRWSLAADGKVVDIPYAKVPRTARTRSWPVVEYYGMVCVYIDDEGRAPPYYPPRVPELDAGTFKHRGDFVADDVRMHLQEFAENSVDFQHFDPLHGRMMVPWTSYSMPLITIDHTAGWVPGSDDEGPHIAHFKDHAELRFAGRCIPNSSADADITFVGPAGIVIFRFILPNLGDIVMFQTHLPLAPALQRCEFRWFADPAIPRALVWYVVGNWVSQWGNDRQVWENKVFLPKPLLVRGDGPVQRLRRWYQQFYAGGRPKVEVAQGTPAEAQPQPDDQREAHKHGHGAAAADGSAPPACAPPMHW